MSGAAAANWRGLIDGLIEGVLLVDPVSLRIIEANPLAESLLGRSRAELIDRPIIDFTLTPEDLCFWEDAAAGLGGDIYSESVLRRADGSILQVDRRVSRVRLTPETTVYLVGLRDQTQQRQTEDELERLIAELRATLESTADGVLVTDLNESIRGYNAKFAEIWGLPQTLLTQRDDAAVMNWMAEAAADPAGYAARCAQIRAQPLRESSDLIVLRNGRVLERVSMPHLARGQPLGRVCSFRDITRRLADEARLRLASRVFDASLDAIFVTDEQFQIIAANPSAARLTGHSSETLLTLTLARLIFDPDQASRLADLISAARTQGFTEAEAWCRRSSGVGSPCQVALVHVTTSNAAAFRDRARWIVFLRDLSERVAANLRIEQLAYNDALTGLPNRALLLERIEYATQLAARERQSLAVLLIDLDRFKQINDSLGHLFGDRVLVEIASRIRRCLRLADTAARQGGDEFVLLLHDTDAHGAETTARKVLAALSEPLALDDLHLTVTSSIGIALYPADGETVSDLVKNAETAMYRVKERGRSGFRFYQRQMNVDLLSRMKLDHAMRVGLDNQAFRLHYQPQIALETGQLVGAEALLRWRDPELGEVSPGRFIPVAEETGFIAALGQWVLNEAVQQARRWLDRHPPIVVAINVSALQFQLPGFVEQVRDALACAGLPAQRIELELTETILVQEIDETLSRLQALASLGVNISIDDFGTGYSSLTYLKRFPINKLKIDRSFIEGLPEDESDAAIVRAIVHLGQALKLQTIAEGVETESQRDFLLERGCCEYQGFLCAPALSPEAFEQRFFSLP